MEQWNNGYVVAKNHFSSNFFSQILSNFSIMTLSIHKHLLVLFIGLSLAAPATAQEELMNLIDEQEEQEEQQYSPSIFTGTRVIQGHSVETQHKKTLEVLISHRFGRINLGAHELFGLDEANIRLGVEYGITDNINVGIGRSSFDKTFDSFFKYRFLRQTDGGSPLTMTLFSSLAIRTTPRADDDPTYSFNDRLGTTYQLLLARKVSDVISLQLMPTLVHKTRVEAFDENTQLAIGIAGKIALTKGLALNTEYYYRIDPAENSPYKNAVSIGFDIETGGHIFQLHFTNSVMTVERAFITETSDDFFDGDIHFGFNISRVFQLGK